MNLIEPSFHLGWNYQVIILHNWNILEIKPLTIATTQHKVSDFQEAQKLQEYGVLFHKVSKFKKDRRGGFSLGICVRGMLVYEVWNFMKYI